ncbi:TPA: sensor histidine kinase [Streptococcus suis]
MNLQKRIFGLNMVMLVLSLVAMLGISIFVANNIYQNQESWQTSSQKTANSQTSLEAFTGTDFTSLAEQLAPSGAQLYVSSNGKTVFSNIQEDVEDVTSVSISSATHTAYVDEEIIISREISTAGTSYQLYVVIENNEDQKDSEDFQDFLLQIATVGGTGILLILAFNWFFTRRILRVIMQPLDQLHDGVERIQQGNYEEPLTYKGDKEFEELTDGFNQMQTSLLEAQEQNRLYEQNRTQMVADISHDLRTPLTSIKGYAKGILDGVANTDEKRTNYLNIIYQKSLVMEKLLEKLFVFSQLETDKLPFDTVTTDLRQVFEDYVAEKSTELADQAVTFDLQLPEPLIAAIDPVQFRRILDNLVDNARKYAVVSPLVLTISGQTKGEQLIWTFADNGQGVAEDKLAQLFDEFYRVDEARRQIDGHGLGLAIIKNIVTRLGGSISVQSQNGLQFTFTLPRKDMK